MNSADLQVAWARWLIDAFVACGVRRAVVSPGSRSTPLVLAIAAAETRGRLESTVVVDERSAGFFALGQSRATNEPTLLVCTSGTARSHYLPAVVEASESSLPLIALTADRPFELRGRGASQTIDQAGMFGRFVRKSIEVGPPDADPRAVDGLLRTVVLATHTAAWPLPGPVHLNLGLRKPLEPSGGDGAELQSLEARVAATLAAGLPIVARPTIQADARALDEAAARIRKSSRGVLVLGPMNPTAAPASETVEAFVRATGFPVLAEATSQHRFGDADYASVCDPFEPLFASPRFISENEPDLVVHLGEAPVSRALGSWIDTSEVERLVIGAGRMSEPFNQAAQYLVGDAGWTLQALAERLSAPDGLADEGWVRRVAEASATATEAVETLLAASPAETLLQGKAVRLAVQAVPAGGLLMVGNSMPVRDVDLYCRASARGVQVLSQRGASGIDGLMSGAIGAVSATGRPTVLVLGDVSFQHDIGGLALGPTAIRAEAPLAIVVLQNGGGRLFERLPVRDLKDIDATFERYFLTPAKLSVPEASRAFGVQATRVTEPGALAESLARAMAEPGVTVIEAVVDGASAAGATGRIAATVDRALSGQTGS